MNGKENIINKILADADMKCQEILSSAQEQAQQILDGARATVEAEKAQMAQKLAKISAERTRNSLATAKLEARKYKLQKMQQLISSCYQKALAQLANLSGEQRKAFVAKLLEKYAEQGETVRICSADKDVVTQSFLDGFGKNLVLGTQFVQAQGGIVLEGKNYDKDLTLEKLVAYCREETESKVAAALFGE